MVPQQGQLPHDLFRQLVDGFHQALVVLDPDGGARYVNAAWRELVGGRGGPAEWSRLDEVFGRLCRPGGGPVEESGLPWQRLRRETFSGYRLHAVAPWWRGALLSFSGVRVSSDEGEEPYGVLLVDEQRSGGSDELFRQAFEKGPVPVSIVRADDGVILDVNPALLELLECPREAMVGHSLPELAERYDVGKLHGSWRALAAGGEVEFLETELTRRDGSPLMVYSWYRRLEVDGSAYILGVHLDVSERREMQRRLEEATQLVLQRASEFSRGVVNQLERLQSRGDIHSDRGGANGLSLLTRRERDVVTRVGAGHSNMRIAADLQLTPQTVRNYVTRIYRKIGVTNRAEAVVWARERGMVGR